MLFCALHFPTLPLDVFERAAPSGSRPLVVDSGGHVPTIVAANAAARAAGIADGMLLSAAYALAPDLVAQLRDSDAEETALAEIATYALRFTPAVSIERPLAVVADIGASLRLFRGREALVARLSRGIALRGFAPGLGLAPTRLAALALARAGDAGPVVSLDALANALAPLSLRHFDLPRDACDTLAAAGIATFGQADRLPREGLARRFGPALVDALDRAAGRRADPREPYMPPSRFVMKLELPSPVHEVERLEFAVNRLVHALAEWLAARCLGARSLVLALAHERALVRHRDSLSTEARFALGAPSRTPRHLMHVVRERLARLALPAPVAAITLATDDVAPLSGRNLALLPGDDAVSPEVPLLDRLRARLGDDAVHCIVPHAEHRPELAMRDATTITIVTAAQGTHAAPRLLPPRPTWLLAEPQPLASVLDNTPWVLREGPERIESGWWDGRDVRRDYYVAERPDGAIVWIYRDHRYGTDDGEWFLHGIFA